MRDFLVFRVSVLGICKVSYNKCVFFFSSRAQGKCQRCFPSSAGMHPRNAKYKRRLFTAIYKIVILAYVR